MPVITSVHDKEGYNELVRFLNYEFANPSSGNHSVFVSDTANTLPTNDVIYFLGELYSDPVTYWGSILVDTNYRLLILRDDICRSFVYDRVFTELMFAMNSQRGLERFYSTTIPVFDNQSGLETGTLEAHLVNEYGADTYYFTFRESNSVVANCRIQSETIVDQRSGTYNIKIDLTPYSVIVMRGLRNELTKFQIRVGDTSSRNLAVVENFSYTKVGDIMLVQDTPESRQEVSRLIRLGVVSAVL